MKQSDKFFEWVESNGIRLRDECHEEIARTFDLNCEVNYYDSMAGEIDGIDSMYCEITKVTFSDGSIAEFNYKGERK